MQRLRCDACCRHSGATPQLASVALAIVAVAACTAWAAPVAEESFDYGEPAPVELEGQDGGTGWGGPWTAMPEVTEVIEPAEPHAQTSLGVAQ